VLFDTSDFFQSEVFKRTSTMKRSNQSIHKTQGALTNCPNHIQPRHSRTGVRPIGRRRGPGMRREIRNGHLGFGHHRLGSGKFEELVSTVFTVSQRQTATSRLIMQDLLREIS